MDQQDSIVEQVKAAVAERSPLAIQGGGTKAFYGYPTRGKPLHLSGHSGVVEYDPGELVMTCRGGSRLAEIITVLKDHGQHLPFEPPACGEGATIGGTVACGFSGPRRPWSGSLRDYLLGVKLVNGCGEVVSFGGRVMKNVAGYDISRLLAGSMGTLGVVLEASFKVLPLPARELSLGFECGQGEAIRRVNEWAGQPLPLSGAFWWRGRLLVRLSGAETELGRAADRMQADQSSEDPQDWTDLREFRSEFFAGPEDLWRLALPAATAPIDLAGDCLVDWAGAQRWYRPSLEPGEIRELATKAGGHATLFRGDSDVERFHPLPAALQRLQLKVKQAMDPHGVFNPHRMSRAW